MPEAPKELISETETKARLSVLENNYNILSHDVEKLEHKLDENYATLHSRISGLRDDLKDDYESKHEKLIYKLEEHNVTSQRQAEKIQEKFNAFERWRYLLYGGAIVAGYILAHINVDKLF